MAGPLVPHVIVVALENESISSVIGSPNFPHITALSQAYGTCTHFYAISHPSLPNYLAWASGDNQGVCDDHGPSSPGISAGNLFSSLSTAGVAWKVYAESIPSDGFLGGDTGQYAARHNPVVYFKDFRSQTAAFQQSHLVNYTDATHGFVADINGGVAPPFCFVTPNVTHDGHTDPSHTCDGFVFSMVQTVQSSTWYTQNNGIIVLWWDEAAKSDLSGIGDKTSCPSTGGGNIACVVISAANKGAAPFTANVNHYGFLFALEKLYGISPLLGKSAHTINGDLSPLLSVGGGGGGQVSVSPTALSYSAVQGGSNPPSQTVTLSNTTASSVSYTTASSASTWLAVSPTSGSIAGGGGSITATISVTTGSLAAGTYTGTITYSGSFGSLVVSVSFVVAAAGAVSVSPTSLLFTATQGGGNPASQNVILRNTKSTSVSYTATTNAPWLAVAPINGSITGSGGTATSAISVTIGTLTAGTYNGMITYSGTFGSITVSVSFVVAPQGNATTSNLGNGFFFNVPADTTSRTLKVYADVNAGTGTLAASLTDGSDSDYIDSSLSNPTGTSAGVYSLTYQAAAPNQRLSVSYTLSGGVTKGTVISSDTFNRANQTGLGTATGDPAGNETYQLMSEVGSPAWSIASNQAKLTSSTAGNTGVALLGTHTLADCEAVGIVQLGSSADTPGLVLRATSGAASYYHASLTQGSIQIAFITAGTSTVLSSQPATLTASPSSYWLRFRACKSSLYARYWPNNGSKEPTNWHVFVTNTALANAGQYGLRGVVGAASDIINFDTYSVVDLSATGDPSYVSIYAADVTGGGGIGGGGALSGSSSTPSGTIDLTAEGTGDWAHWGLSSAISFDHKTGVTQQISNLASIGSGTPTQDSSTLLAYTWTGDGTPDASATASTTGSSIQGVSNGFSFTVPADTISRTLNVYVQATKAQGILTATLSDNSASAFTDSSLNDVGTGSVKKYTITYNAASANQTLTVMWVMQTDNGGGSSMTTSSTDSFTRANAASWGTASDGTSGSWVQNTLTGSPVASIVSNKGQITASAIAAVLSILGTSTQTNAESSVRWVMSSTADSAGLALRCTNSSGTSNTEYRANITGGNLLSIDRVVAGVATTLQSAAISFVAATAYKMKFRITGSNLFAKHWIDSSSEPSAWTVTATDTSASAIAGAGTYGIRTRIAANGDTVKYDNFLVTSIPGGGTPGSIELHAATVSGVIGPPPPPPPPPPAITTSVTVNQGSALSTPFLGFGVEQDPYTQGAWITNGSFEDTGGSPAYTPWQLTVTSPAVATASVDSSTAQDGTTSAKISITTANSGNPFFVQFRQQNIIILNGATYMISFFAKASVARPIDVMLQQQISPFTVYGQQTVNITTSWQSYTVSVIATVSDTVFLGFNLAAVPDNVWLDAVSITALPNMSTLRPLINTRLNSLSPPLIRTVADSVSWWCPSGVVGTYDFTNPLMQEWFAVFDNAQAQEYNVIVGVGNPSPFGVTSASWCTAFADLVDYLINTLNYTYITYASGLARPDINGAVYTDYKNTIEPNLVAALSAHNLLNTVSLIGPDTTNANDSWLTSASTDLKNTLVDYSRHDFPTGITDISSGSREIAASTLLTSISANDNTNKPVISTIADGALGPGGLVAGYQYGVEMADLAVQLVRAGMAGIIAYLLDDDMHGTQWGMWQITQDTGQPRPWFFPWSVLSTTIPADSTIYAPAQPTTNDLRALAAQSPQGGWTFVLINRLAATRNVQLSVPFAQVTTTTLSQYIYAEAIPLMVDGNGFPLPSGTVQAVLARGFTVRVAGNSLVILTQQSSIQTNVFNVKRPPLQKRR